LDQTLIVCEKLYEKREESREKRKKRREKRVKSEGKRVPWLSLCMLGKFNGFGADTFAVGLTVVPLPLPLPITTIPLGNPTRRRISSDQMYEQTQRLQRRRRDSHNTSMIGNMVLVIYNKKYTQENREKSREVCTCGLGPARRGLVGQVKVETLILLLCAHILRVC